MSRKILIEKIWNSRIKYLGCTSINIFIPYLNNNLEIEKKIPEILGFNPTFSKTEKKLSIQELIPAVGILADAYKIYTSFHTTIWDDITVNLQQYKPKKGGKKGNYWNDIRKDFNSFLYTNDYWVALRSLNVKSLQHTAQWGYDVSKETLNERMKGSWVKYFKRWRHYRRESVRKKLRS